MPSRISWLSMVKAVNYILFSHHLNTELYFFRVNRNILRSLSSPKKNMCVLLGSWHRALFQILMVKEDSSILWGRSTFSHFVYYGHRGNNLKITFPQVPQQSICITQTRKEFINEKLFQDNQIHFENNILAQGTSVGLMTRRGTHCLGHDPQRATNCVGRSRNSRQQPWLWGHRSDTEKNKAQKYDFFL